MTIRFKHGEFRHQILSSIPKLLVKEWRYRWWEPIQQLLHPFQKSPQAISLQLLPGTPTRSAFIKTIIRNYAAQKTQNFSYTGSKEKYVSGEKKCYIPSTNILMVTWSRWCWWETAQTCDWNNKQGLFGCQLVIQSKIQVCLYNL